MQYLAHRTKDTQEEQTLKEHLENTAELAGKFAGTFGCKEWGYCLGMLHDIGKYSEEFQARIRGNGKKVDHATAGTQICWEKGGLYTFLSYCIAGHHTGLPDTGEQSDSQTDRTIQARRKKKICDYSMYKNEIKIPELVQMPFQVRNCETTGLVCSVFIRMLYSCLVDADFLDTEQFMQHGQANRIPGLPMTVLAEKFRNHISGWIDNPQTGTLNGRRTEILVNCMKRGQDEKGIFRLTVPTGGGKTTASLGFALEHAAKHNLDHIIYVIPYTSIIEQNAEVFRKILGEENVLEHHSNVNYEDDEELTSLHLASENWDKPVIVTTNVQFFESFFSNKSSKCRKLHNMANSVIIFDEAQMLPSDYLKPCILAIEELVQHYQSSVVLCTATQPALEGLFSQEMAWTELCPNAEEQYDAFRRTGMEYKGMIDDGALIECLLEETQALCILNTRKKAQEIYQAITGEGVYHLSTLMYPAHRKRILNEIKQKLKNHEKCIVIATSLIEAGVDVDFQTVYRQLAGLDSMIQAAGRCNREGKRSLDKSRVFIFELDQEKAVFSQRLPIAVSKNIMEKYEEYTSPDAVQEYFQMLYHYRGTSLDKKNIIGQFRKGRFPFETVSKQFRLIEQNTKTIFVAKEEKAMELLEEIRYKGATRKLMREAGQYSVNVYDDCFQKMNAAGMLQVVSEELKEDFFVLRDSSCYKEDVGLAVTVEYGDAVWF